MSRSTERRVPPGGIPYAPELGELPPLPRPPFREEQRQAFNGLYEILHAQAAPLKAKLDQERGGVPTDLTAEQRQIAKGLEVTQASIERATGTKRSPEEVIARGYRGRGRYRNEFTSRNPERPEFSGESWEQYEGMAAEHLLAAGQRRIDELMHYKGDGTWFAHRRKEAKRIQRQMQVVEASTRTYRETHTHGWEMPWDVRVEQEQAYNFHQSPENRVFDSSLEPGRAHMDNDWLMAAGIMEARREFTFNDDPGVVILPGRLPGITLAPVVGPRRPVGAVPAALGSETVPVIGGVSSPPEPASVAGVPATFGILGYPGRGEAVRDLRTRSSENSRRRRRWPWLLLPIPVAVGLALLQCNQSGAPETPVNPPSGSPTPDAPLVAMPTTPTEGVLSPPTLTDIPTPVEAVVPTQPAAEPTRGVTPTAIFRPGSPVTAPEVTPTVTAEPSATPIRGKVPPELIEPVPTTVPRRAPVQIPGRQSGS
jgi:hypothetical protein